MERMTEEKIKEIKGKKFFVKLTDGAKFRGQILMAIDRIESEVQFLYFQNKEGKLNIFPSNKIERLEEE